MVLTATPNGEYHLGMDFRTYFYGLSIDDRQKLADSCCTTVGHLRNIAYGKPCRERLAVLIERESGGVVMVESLCPDVDWQYVFVDGASLRSGKQHLSEAA